MKELKIGNITLENPFLLAPLAGITDAPMRRICKEMGAAMVYSEMVSAKGLYYGDKNTEKLLRIFDDEKPIAFQFFGSEPEMLRYAAQKTAGMGNAIFDINMGCPVPKIVKNGEGSALLKNPELVYDIVCAAVKGAREGAKANREAGYGADWNCERDVGSEFSCGDGSALGREGGRDACCGDGCGVDCGSNCGSECGDWQNFTKMSERQKLNAGESTKIVNSKNKCQGIGFPSEKPVTVKIRMGFDAQSINAVEVAKAAECAGAAAVAVHGRTREQYYSGCADWDIIRKVREAVGIPVIGNGDVFAGEDARAIMERTGCDFVMIARGALGNPWIFAEALAAWRGEPRVAKPSRAAKLAVLCRHFEEVLAFKGEYAAVREMRKHVGWYLKGEHGSASVRRAVSGIETAEEMRELFNNFQLPIT